MNLLLSVSISRGSAISIRSRISPTLRRAKVATNTKTHLDQVEVNLPVVSCPGGDESVAILVFLGGVHWSYLLSRHSRLEVKPSYCNQHSLVYSLARLYQPTEENGSVFWLEEDAAGVLARGCCLRSLFSNSVSIMRRETNPLRATGSIDIEV